MVRTFPTGTRRSCCARRTKVSFTDDIDGTPRKEYLHQRVRKAHLGPVDGTIARRLDQREDIVVARVNGDALQRGLRSTICQSAVCLSLLFFNLHICAYSSRKCPSRARGCGAGHRRQAQRKTHLEDVERRRHGVPRLFSGERSVCHSGWRHCWSGGGGGNGCDEERAERRAGGGAVQRRRRICPIEKKGRGYIEGVTRGREEGGRLRGRGRRDVVVQWQWVAQVIGGGGRRSRKRAARTSVSLGNAQAAAPPWNGRYEPPLEGGSLEPLPGC